MPGRRDPLYSVAEAVTDGNPLDWDSEVRAHRDLEGQMEQLRVIEKIAATSGGGLETTDLRAWGKFEIEQWLGKGGFAEVYRAHDPDLDKDVALKLLSLDRFSDGADGDRFVREARRHAKVRHPSIVDIQGADRFENRVGLWMDLIQGQTLDELLERNGPFGHDEATAIAIHLCGAVAEVHAHGLVHGDIKAKNVMRERGGRIVLMDFGSATESPPRPDASLDERLSGTPLYMAPERFDGAPPSAATDIYALGVLIYHLVSGRYPVDAASFVELLDKHRERQSTPLRDVRPDLPSSFVRVIEQALAADPGRRFRSAGEMERALADSIGVAQPERAPARVPWRAAAWAGAALAAATVLWLIGNLATSYTVTATFYGGMEGRARLAQDTTLAVGDSLSLDLRASKPLFVYVINKDERGSLSLLFPLAGVEPSNPLSPGRTHRLPGARNGKPVYWEVTSAGETERFLIVGSRRRLSELEDAIMVVPPARFDYVPPGDDAPEIVLRGVGAVREGEEPTDPGGLDDLFDQAQRLAAGSERVRGMWVRSVEFRNPP